MQNIIKKNRNYDDLTKSIFRISKTIRFVEIYHHEEKISMMRDGLESLLNNNETKKSIDDAVKRWKTRTALSEKLGEPVYAMAEYKKIKRITIPFDNNGLILISLDSEGFHEVILKEIIEIKNRFLSP